MDMQAFIDAIGDAAHAARSQYHLTLGRAIEYLSAANPASPVRYDVGGSPRDAHSYRGYYSDLAFETGSGSITVADFLDECRAALGNVFMGYKGGDFTMTTATPLWSASYGGGGGRAIIDIREDAGSVVLITKVIE